ncbi:MAG: tail fiber domain-containing protein, partial [Betaproteobacteria bacterium]
TVVSDARDKTDFQAIPHGLSFVQQLNPVSFYFKESRDIDVKTGIKRYGFKAQEILALEGDNAVIIDNENPDKLRYNGEVIDLVYNRLTDFSLSDAQHADLREAYLANAVVLSPHPQAHALFADKRNLVTLTDDAALHAMGVSEADRRLLATGIPNTIAVTPENAQSLWERRKQCFFKPAAGYGSKAAYRGDKLTKRVFAEISRGGYVAQALVVPSERRLLVDGSEQNLKLDLRNYVYQGEVQLVSARLYQGQTTNFRTPGGGFAAVFPVPCQAGQQLCEK